MVARSVDAADDGGCVGVTVSGGGVAATVVAGGVGVGAALVAIRAPVEGTGAAVEGCRSGLTVVARSVDAADDGGCVGVAVVAGVGTGPGA